MPFSASHFLQSIHNGFTLDIATFCYIAILPLISYCTYLIKPKKIWHAITKALIYTFSLIHILIFTAEIITYREWKSKLSVQAILHLQHPKEIIRTAGLWDFIYFTIILLGSMSLVLVLGRKYLHLHRFKPNFQISIPAAIITTLLLLGLCVIGLRGGLQPIPIQVSDACRSNNNTLNDVATNTSFSFLANYRNYLLLDKSNVFQHVTITKASKTVDSLYTLAKNSEPTNILVEPATKPNIVLLLMEGISADLVKSFGGENFMPFLDSMATNGLRFTQCYAGAHLSDMGNASVLAGYPASPSASVLMIPTKSKQLPSINQVLQPFGYQSSYYFGGQLTYGNIKQYLLQSKWDIVKDETNIPDKNYKKQNLGINDVDMSNVFAKALATQPQPFLSTWFNISSHSPYDVPITYKPLCKTENAYANAAMYYDKALQNFFAQASQADWYTNTLFIIVSDHSHSTHKQFAIADAQYHRIPLIFFGPALNKQWQGKAINYTVSQADIAYTLAENFGNNPEQLKQYKYSKSLLNSKLHFAPYCHFAGAGLVIDSSAVCYNVAKQSQASFTKNTNATIDYYARCFGEVLYEDYRLK